MNTFKITLYVLIYILFGFALYQLGQAEGQKYIYFPLILGHIVIFLIAKEKIKNRKVKKEEQIKSEPINYQKLDEIK